MQVKVLLQTTVLTGFPASSALSRASELINLKGVRSRKLEVSCYSAVVYTSEVHLHFDVTEYLLKSVAYETKVEPTRKLRIKHPIPFFTSLTFKAFVKIDSFFC